MDARVERNSEEVQLSSRTDFQYEWNYDSSEHRVKVLLHANDSCPFTVNENKLEYITLGLCISAFGGYLRSYSYSL